MFKKDDIVEHRDGDYGLGTVMYQMDSLVIVNFDGLRTSSYTALEANLILIREAKEFEIEDSLFEI